jgi:uncharacterized protein
MKPMQLGTSFSRRPSSRAPARAAPQFLLKVKGDSKLGPWRYEPLDAKLARAEKPTYVLQLCFYSDGIAAIQGERPEHIHVFLGVGEQRALRYDDFAAYYRRVRARFQTAVDVAASAPSRIRSKRAASASSTALAADGWRAEDSLVLVAGVRRAQGRRAPRGRASDAARTRANCVRQVANVAPHDFESLRDQAALQLERRASGKLAWHPIESDAGRGFALLPRPSAGDVIFDIEGDPFWQPARGLHFLFGLLFRGTAANGITTRSGRTIATKSADVRAVHRSRPRPTGRRRGDARLPLRQLRERGDQAADGHVRDARE